MGYMCHHGIMVTSWNDALLKRAHEKAIEIFSESDGPIAAYSGDATSLISPITDGITNGYGSFAIFPDGSKEGWDLSDDVEAKRDEFVAWLEDQAYDDGSTSFAFALIQFGDEEGHNGVLRHDYSKRQEGLVNG